ncbi:MAG TPA: hypothetical protein VGD72_04395 [Mycobacteriales bacterium]
MPPPYVAQLRVYEPLAAFEGPEQERWRRYAAAGAAPEAGVGALLERAAATRTLVGLRLPADGEIDHAYVAAVDGVTVVCPWSLRERMAEAAVGASEGVSDILAAAFVPPALRAEAEGVVARRRARGADPRTHVTSATWGVPVRWFALFDDEERTLVLREGARALTYRTEMSRARRRAARALSVLRRSLGDGAGVVQAVEGMARWLEEFHPRSLVELDYGGLVGLLGDEDLRRDHSAADVAATLAALASGDGDEAGQAYERVIVRWREIESAERVN